MTKPFILVAPNGARRGKADHPALPVSIPEIVATADACRLAGADGVHLHIRDDDGQHSLDAGLYREALSELAQSVPDMRVQITTESADLFGIDQQLACLEQVRPSWASIAVREVAKAPELADRVYGGCFENGCEVQHILYDTADLAILRDWQENGTVRSAQTSVIYVLGRYSAGQVSDPDDLLPFLDADTDRKDWMICAFGPREHDCLLSAAAHGGNLRVGFENSLHNKNGQLHTDNAASVAALVQQLQERQT